MFDRLQGFDTIRCLISSQTHEITQVVWPARVTLYVCLSVVFLVQWCYVAEKQLDARKVQSDGWRVEYITVCVCSTAVRATLCPVCGITAGFILFNTQNRSEKQNMMIGWSCVTSTVSNVHRDSDTHRETLSLVSIANLHLLSCFYFLCWTQKLETWDEEKC